MMNSHIGYLCDLNPGFLATAYKCHVLRLHGCTVFLSGTYTHPYKKANFCLVEKPKLRHRHQQFYVRKGVGRVKK